MIKAANCQAIVIRWFNKQSPKDYRIIESISHICFTSLKTINLWNDRIKSIEAIAHLNMESIEEINLSDNFITSIKPFNKSNWSQLREINLRFNYLR